MIRFSLKDRCETIAEYVLENNATVRAAAKHFGISKSTIHKDLTYKLQLINPSLHTQVKNVLEFNKSERHIRGGEATKKKYLKKREAREKKE